MRTRLLLGLTLLAMAVGIPLGSLTAQAADTAQEQANSADGIDAALRAETAEQAVEIATEEVLALIRRGQAYASDDPERFYVEVEALLRPLIDFPRFARSVMGAYYRDASDVQRRRFSDSFKWSLVRTYALALTEFRDGEVNVLVPRRKPRDPNRVNVNMEIKYQGRSYAVVYVMRRGKQELWRLQNLVIEGINVGLNYKSQFAAAMKDPAYDGDMDKVIDAWSQFVEDEEQSDDAAENQTAAKA